MYRKHSFNNFGSKIAANTASLINTRRGILFFILPVAFLLSGCATAPKTDINIDYYQVSGNTAQKIVHQLSVHGPYIPGKGRALAAAKITMEQRIQVAERPESCRVADARISIRAEVTLPKWKQRDAASEDLGRNWDEFAAYAEAHERFHVRIAEEYGRLLEHKLEAIPTLSDCKSVAKIISTISKDVVSEMNKAQDKFDDDEDKRLRLLDERSNS